MKQRTNSFQLRKHHEISTENFPPDIVSNVEKLRKVLLTKLAIKIFNFYNIILKVLLFHIAEIWMETP